MSTLQETLHVLDDIAHERIKQDAKWGEQNHLQVIWLGILAEEFGEAAKKVNEFHFMRKGPKDLREELIQTAAVAVAVIESLDRNGK